MSIVYSALLTPDGTILESLHRHDYRTHLDKNGNTYMIDGGCDYLRCSANGDEVPIQISIEDDHEIIRSSMKWGTRGKYGDQPLKYVLLKDMSTNHIKACLDPQMSMSPQFRQAMISELEYRLEKPLL